MGGFLRVFVDDFQQRITKAAMSKISAAALLQLADQFDRQKKCLDLREKVILAIWEGSLNVSQKFLGWIKQAANVAWEVWKGISSLWWTKKNHPWIGGREEFGTFGSEDWIFCARNQVFYMYDSLFDLYVWYTYHIYIDIQVYISIYIFLLFFSRKNLHFRTWNTRVSNLHKFLFQNDSCKMTRKPLL